MNLKDKVQAQPFVEINDHEVECIDTVTDDGVETIASIMGSPYNYSDSWMPYIGIGSGITAPTTSDTAMEDELHRKKGTVTVVDNTYFVEADFALDEPTDDCTIREVAIFDSLSGGKMGARWTLVTAVSKESEDSVNVRCSVTIT